MSIRFFMTSYKPTDYERREKIFDSQLFSDAIKQKWTQAEIIFDERGGFLWSIIENNGFKFTGGCAPSGESISMLPGSWQLIHEFIAWVRLFIPLKYELFLFSSVSSEDYALIDKHYTIDDVKHLLDQVLKV